MHSKHSPGQSCVLEPVDFLSSSYWQSDCHCAGGCRASLPPSELLLHQHSHRNFVLQYIAQIHGEAMVTPWALQTCAYVHKYKQDSDEVLCDHMWLQNISIIRNIKRCEEQFSCAEIAECWGRCECQYAFQSKIPISNIRHWGSDILKMIILALVLESVKVG